MCLQAWHPSDPSAFYMLKPWKDVFAPAHMETLLVRCILPKLVFEMRKFVINPQQQNLDIFKWVMRWQSLIPDHHMIALLENEFFPKWLEVLHAWLTNTPNYEEVTQWYLNWKKLFPETILKQKSIQDQFNRALMVMNSAISGTGSIPAPMPQVPYTRPPITPNEAVKQKREAVSAPKEKFQQLSFKEVIQQLAEENDILFIPTTKRHNGKQIYSFGSVFIFIDKDLVFYQVGDNKWQPVSIEDLIIQARKSKSSGVD